MILFLGNKGLEDLGRQEEENQSEVHLQVGLGRQRAESSTLSGWRYPPTHTHPHHSPQAAAPGHPARRKPRRRFPPPSPAAPSAVSYQNKPSLPKTKQNLLGEPRCPGDSPERG